ncbi:MAG: tetratricopeptide repeat protein [Alphaproteobacteria bacterium]|nr:tetratricopeptide repeat protein [Alphaproteobacteria bacterium]
MALRRAARLDDAIALLARIDDGRQHDIAVTRGGLLAEAGRTDEALACLRQAVAHWPRSAAALYNMARVLRDKGDLGGAVAAHERIAVEHPELVPAWRSYGNCLVDLGRIDEAIAAYDRGTLLRRSLRTRDAAHADYRTATVAKLQHDLDQFRWLEAAGAGLPAGGARDCADRLERVLGQVRARSRGAQVVELTVAEQASLAPCYNLILHRPSADRIAGGAIDPRIDWRDVTRRYFENAPGITWVDGLLTPVALEAMRRYCLGATVWFRYRFAKGYVGAFWDDGFSAPLLLQIADELRRAAPAIFGAHLIRKIWAFKYDPELSGIPIHADFAAVNVNFWTTPDDANLAPEAGGLIVWDREAPADWDFDRYNSDEPAMRAFLAASGARQVRVPHRQNRAVLFNSDLLHETDRLSFRPGYENRRVNITMLYGRRADAAPAS